MNHRMALGELAMTPQEFWHATPADIFYRIRGNRWRERRSWERLGWAVANIINVWASKPVSIGKLLEFLGPEEGTKAAEEKTPAEIKAHVEAIAKALKPKAWAFLPGEFAPPQDGDK